MPVVQAGRLSGRALRVGRALLRAALVLTTGCSPQGSLRILVLDNSASPGPVENASVVVQGTVHTAQTDLTGYAILVGVPPGTYTIRASAIGQCPSTAVASVLAGAVSDVTVTLCPPLQAPVPGNDQLTLPLDTGTPAVALLDGRVDPAACLADYLASGTAIIPLGLNFRAPGSSGGNTVTCHTSLTVFTASNGLLFTNTSADLPWTVGTDDLALDLPSRLNLPVTIWIAPGVASDDLDALIEQVHLAIAQTSLDAAGAGLVLVRDESAGGAVDRIEIPVSSPGALLFPASGTGCDDAAALMAEPTIYQKDRLNVYYVKQITGRGASSTGYYCYENGAPSILFIRADASVPHILAHELGHALGLLDPNWGHTHDYFRGFLTHADDTPRNVMAYGAASSVDRPVYFSAGQAVRMNLSALSWVNLPGASGTSLRERAAGTGPPPPVVPCACAPGEATDDCPPLALTALAQDHVTEGVSYHLACGVAPAAADLSLCVGEATGLTITYTTTLGTVTVGARSNEVWWMSGDPGVAKVTDPAGIDSGFDPVTGGWSKQELVGVATGTTEVVVRAGGASAVGRFNVTVKSCP